MSPSPLIIVADTNILINFLNVDRLDLIAEHSHHFVITDHVSTEITDLLQKEKLQQAIRNRVFTERQLVAIEEIQLFANLMRSNRIGSGESSAITCAVLGKHKLAIDDRRAIQEAKKVEPNIQVMTTRDIIVSMIKESLLDVTEADHIKTYWAEKHRFRLKFGSFSELV